MSSAGLAFAYRTLTPFPPSSVNETVALRDQPTRPATGRSFRKSVMQKETKAPRIRESFADFWRALTKDMAGPYRPERHYMRGPGPKWHAKHDRALALTAQGSLEGMPASM
jgi:hypothetical protein